MQRKSALEAVRPKPGSMDAEDLYLQLQVYAKGRAAFIDEPLVEVRRHGANSYTSSDQIREAVLRAVELAARDLPFAPAHLAVVRRRVGFECCRRGHRYFWSHDLGRAARYYARALGWPGSRLNALAHLIALPAVPLLPRREPHY